MIRALLIVCLFLLPASAWSSGSDTLCGSPLLLHFRFDRSLVEYDYMDNPHTLEAFSSLFSDSIAATRIDTLVIAAYASPDGNAHYNFRLAHTRAVAVKGYLLWKYPHLDQHRILIRPQGENWTGLRQLVTADLSVPDREDVLRILAEVLDRERCKFLLKRLNCGFAYDYIQKKLLPLLRNAAVCTVQLKSSDTRPLVLTVTAAEQRNTSLVSNDKGIYNENNTFFIPVIPETFRTNLAVSRPKLTGVPLIALKTNLSAWAGLTSEGDLASFRPNLAAEFFFAHCWSVQASAEYSRWEGGKGNKFWGISGYSFEPRLWLCGTGTYRWLYIGTYGQSGDFDYRISPDADTASDNNTIPRDFCSTGTYWSTGLSLGIYVPLTRRLGLEAGLRGGYRKASCKAYEYEPPHAYYHHDFSSEHWGITGINLSISYRWLTK
ncbi:DUF3575 domain-containing protein [Bacteroides sp.]|uniref:DUF3575 domain-containing protein n=1 Tax=Bacteroides sp. TaxID=29523 RepID=UPI0026273B1A|nr:DUF3575 domain-containing protein [Bacteroides sp.]